MSTKRYLLAVDRNEGGQLFKIGERGNAKDWSDFIPHEANGGGRLFEIDLAHAFDVTDREPTDHERYEFVESTLLWATQEEARLRPALGGEPVLPAMDLSELREAAKEWCKWIDKFAGAKKGQDDQRLHAALTRLFPELGERRKESA